MRGAKELLWSVCILLVAVAVTGEARAQGLSYTGPSGLFPTNGNKVVVDSLNVLHMIYQESGKVMYTTSNTGGASWSTPFTVSTGSGNMHPTIAVHGTPATVGVAWVQNGTLLYRWKPGSGTWLSPVPVSCTGCAQKPSMVNVGPTIHLVWTSLSAVHYATFDITMPPSTPPNSGQGESVTLDLLCGQRYEYHDVSVAVAPACGNTPAVVQVATTFVEDDRFDCNYPFFDPYILGSGVRVFRRDPAAVAMGFPWPSVYANGRNLCFDPAGAGRPYPNTGSGAACNMLACSKPDSTAPPAALTISASLSAARGQITGGNLFLSGDFLLAWSDTFDSGISSLPSPCPAAGPPNRTMLARMIGGTGSPVWDSPITLTTQRGNVDVINKQEFGSFRAAWSEEAAPFTYGPVNFCSGTWASVAPSLSCSLVDPLGRDPQVLYYQTAAGLQTRAMFDQKQAGTTPTFKLTPYVVNAGETAEGSVYVLGCGDSVPDLLHFPHLHVFHLVHAALAPLGNMIADAGIDTKIGVSLLTQLEKADGALTAGDPDKAAQTLDGLAKKISPKGKPAIPQEVADVVKREIEHLSATLTGKPMLLIANLHPGETVQFLSDAGVSLGTGGGTASELEGLRFPKVAVIARHTGNFNLLLPPSCPTCIPQLAPSASFDIGGLPAAAAGRLVGGGGDDYWFIVELDTTVTAPAVLPIVANLTYDSDAHKHTRPVTISDMVTVALEPAPPCNDVFWNICAAGSGGACDSTNAAFLGQSSFDLSCSDPDMNSDDDCGKLEGNSSGGIVACLPGNNNASCINQWSFTGMIGPTGSQASASLDCSAPTPQYVCTTPITSLSMTWAGTNCVRIAGVAGATPFDIAFVCPGDTVTVAGYECH